MKEKRRTNRVLRPKLEGKAEVEQSVFDDSATITISIAEYNRLRNGQKLTQGQLTREELGSYLPSFEYLADKPNSFKEGSELMAHQLYRSEHWKHIVNHLKQEQVNKLLFSEPGQSLEFIRGSINGIYMFEEIINMLAASRESRMNPNRDT